MSIIAVAVAVAIVVAVAGFFFWNSKLKPIDVDLTSSISKTDIEVAGTEVNELRPIMKRNYIDRRASGSSDSRGIGRGR